VSSVLDDAASAFGSHADEKTVVLLSFSVIRLECPFHFLRFFFLWKQYVNKPRLFCQEKRMPTQIHIDLTLGSKLDIIASQNGLIKDWR
jgi:hypothetical protein